MNLLLLNVNHVSGVEELVVVEASEHINIVADATHRMSLDCCEIESVHFNLTPLQTVWVEKRLLTGILLLKM